MTLAGDLSIFAKTIASDTEHGASHILKIASSSLHTALKRNPDTPPSEIKRVVSEYALRLVTGQRQMASILNFSNRLLIEISGVDSDDDIAKKIYDFAIRISNESSESLVKISQFSSTAIAGDCFLSHSRSSTLLYFFTHLRERKGLTVYCTYSRPGGEGRLLSGELSVAGIRNELIEDCEAMKYLPECSALVVGADAIIPKGIVNKIGTHMLALGAQDLGIPVFCLTDTMKKWEFDEPIAKSLKSKVSRPIPGLDLFEIVPGSLFDKIILESGPVSFKDIQFKTDEGAIAQEIRKLILP